MGVVLVEKYYFYDRSNDQLFHLNRYVIFHGCEDGLILHNILFNTSIKLYLDANQQGDFLSSLHNGIDEERLCALLDKNLMKLSGNELFRLLLKGCVLE